MVLRKKAFKWHRWLSAIATVPLMMWAASAVLHQANAWFRPEFRKAAYEIAPNISETQHAVALVKYLYQQNSIVQSIKKIESFSHHYSEKNKVLPVFEVSMKSPDNTILYVDLSRGRIVTGSNEISRSIHKWFGHLHKWDFLESWPTSRVALIILFSLITLIAGWLGLYLYFLLPWLSRRTPLTIAQKEKLWHRRIGVAVSLFMILFALTGLMHAVSDLYPAFGQSEKPFFDQLHMYRFTDGLGKQFRFWWLLVLASSFVLLIFSGLILLFRLMIKRLYCYHR